MIETLQQWNTRLGYCGCCQMPVCPAPYFVGQNYKRIILSNGFFDPSFPPNFETWTKYRTKIETSTGTVTENFENIFETRIQVDNLSSSYDRVITSTYEHIAHFQASASICTPPPNTGTPIRSCMWTASYEASGSVTVDGVLYSSYTQSKTPVSEDSTYLGISPPCQHVYTDVRSNFSIFDTPNNTFSSSVYTQFSPKLYSGDYDIENNETEYLYAFTKADFMTEARNLVTNFIVPEECWNTVFFLSSFKEDSGFAENATAAKGRFRFRIPTTHLGTKFTITYDVGEFPTGGDPSFVSQDNVVEWTGPGTGASSDPSWLTPWVEIDPPEVPGERRVVNIRFTCYTGTKYGSKPQVMGEALELPPP